MISLCSSWEFTAQWTDTFARGEGSFEAVRLPHTVQELPLHYADSDSYQMLCGYRRNLEITPEMAGKRLFLQFDGSVPFTELVDQAWQQGLTEPDPRDDLSGKDVMRKLVILAREAGYNIEPDQVRVESLVPAHCEGGSIDHFFENGDELNEQMVQRLEAAREMGLVLRYVARFDANGKARVGVEAVREDHPLASLLPCDNVFAIESRWYRDNPLVIRGPGAGRDVTAGAIQSDINRLAQLL